jgi:hypothetical protein
MFQHGQAKLGASEEIVTAVEGCGARGRRQCMASLVRPLGWPRQARTNDTSSVLARRRRREEALARGSRGGGAGRAPARSPASARPLPFLTSGISF